jgi:hypothetical protein
MTATLSVASDVRELTLNEIDDVTGGAVRINFGPIYIGIGEGDMAFTIGIGGLNLTVFNDGDVCGHADGIGGGCI